MRADLAKATTALLLLLTSVSASVVPTVAEIEPELSSSSTFVTINVPSHGDSITRDLTLRLDVFETEEACGDATLHVNGNLLSSPIYTDLTGIHSGHGALDLNGSPGLIASWNLSCADPVPPAAVEAGADTFITTTTQSLTFVIEGLHGVAIPDNFRAGFTAHFRQVQPVTVVVHDEIAAPLTLLSLEPEPEPESEPESADRLDEGEEIASDDSDEVRAYNTIEDHDRSDEQQIQIHNDPLGFALREAEELRARINDLQQRLHNTETYIASQTGSPTLSACDSVACVSRSILTRLRIAASGAYDTVAGRDRHGDHHHHAAPYPLSLPPLSRPIREHPYFPQHKDSNHLAGQEYPLADSNDSPTSVPSDNLPPPPSLSPTPTPNPDLDPSPDLHLTLFWILAPIAALVGLIVPIAALLFAATALMGLIYYHKRTKRPSDLEERQAASERRRAYRRRRRAAVASTLRLIFSCCGLLSPVDEPDDEEKRQLRTSAEYVASAAAAYNAEMADGMTLNSGDESGDGLADVSADESAYESTDESSNDGDATSDSEMSTTMEQDLAQFRQAATIMLDMVRGHRRPVVGRTEPPRWMTRPSSPPSPTSSLPAYARYDDTPPEYASQDELHHRVHGVGSSSALAATTTTTTETPYSAVFDGVMWPCMPPRTSSRTAGPPES